MPSCRRPQVPPPADVADHVLPPSALELGLRSHFTRQEGKLCFFAVHAHCCCLPTLPPQVCGDTGGATRLVLCENVDAGCLGGVHLYCCVPLRSEPPSEAWYCSECEAVRKEAAAARLRARREREAARQQIRAERQQHKADRKRKRQQEKETARRARLRQEEEQRRAASAAQAPPPARPGVLSNGGTGLPAVPRQGSGVAAVIAAASGRTPVTPGVQPAGGRTPSSATPFTPARAAAGPGSALASKDTLSFLFSSLSKEDARQQELREQEERRMTRMLQGDARRMQRSLAQHVRGAGGGSGGVEDAGRSAGGGCPSLHI